MSEGYLDTKKSVIISSPAGSGKTEKLARRYIALLMDNTPLERILCITFTEKAAAEMKERILRIMRKEHPAELAALMPRIPLMRISTIHSFCLKLLRRFSFELGIDPAMEIIDELQAAGLWMDAIYECLRLERQRGTALTHLISERGLKGWGKAVRVLNELHQKRLFIEMMSQVPQDPDAARFMAAYLACLEFYNARKASMHVVDFSDLELMAYRALTKDIEWANILYSFDEHTDHILVDEFQDTSSLQWRIIEKLTEEWRSGLGSKRERGGTPTIFLVGDVKQSIYMFRGGNPSVFKRAGKLFDQWLGREYVYLEAGENYRSLPCIIEFTNRLFAHLMPQGPFEQWKTAYVPFKATRTGEGAVELVRLKAGGESRHAVRKREASLMASMINSKIRAQSPVLEGEGSRPVAYKDIAILLRGRTHLGILEDELRANAIPFVVLKGVGFFDAPEIAVLREFVCFLADPSDDYSLFCLLRSPLFGINAKRLEAMLVRAAEGEALIDRMRASALKDIAHVAAVLDALLKNDPSMTLAFQVESLLTRTRGWETFADAGRRANIKKFIVLVEAYEARGMSVLEVREALMRLKGRGEIPRANINTEDMDAVRIMTVHASKGLQFPYVFFPSIDDGGAGATGPVAIDDEHDTVELDIVEDSEDRKKNSLFNRLRQKDEEEEKRLLYVAITRAMDSLTMLGAYGEDKNGNPKYSGALARIDEAFELSRRTGLPFELMDEADIPAPVVEAAPKAARRKPLQDAPLHVEALSYAPARKWRDVTEQVSEHEFMRRRYGRRGVITGTVMHELFDELSRGIITPGQMPQRLMRMLAEHYATDMHGSVMSAIKRMRADGMFEEIVMPREGAYSELPFVLHSDETIYSGRMDRVIIKGGEVLVYDYKTFAVDDGEVEGIRRQYAPQLELYKDAASRIFDKPARGFLVLTQRPLIIEM